jgi:steroid delta-isomerase-like uncharacterized protein
MTVDILERAAAALTALDTDALLSLYADDFSFEDTSSGECINDKERLREYFRRLFLLPRVRFSEVAFFRCGDLGAGEWTWSGLSLESNQPYSIRGASLFTLDHERITREVIFYDPRNAYK